MRLKETERLHEIKKVTNENLFITNSELYELFNVSIRIICLDRMRFNIPGLCKRVKSVIKQDYEYIKGLETNEVIGDLIQVKLNYSAQSIIGITGEYALQRVRTACGHILFTQANSLCVVLMHSSTVLI